MNLIRDSGQSSGELQDDGNVSGIDQYGKILFGNQVVIDCLILGHA